MTDTKPTEPKPEAKTADKVVIPPKATTTPPKSANDTKSMSSVGVELHPEAPTAKVQGKLAIDASKQTPSEAPQPTPAEVVSYPSTGGLPDTGPNSKYVLGEQRGPELYNRDGERVDADGNLIDDWGNRIPDKGVTEERRNADYNQMRQETYVSPTTKAEMDAGKKALSNR